MKRGKVPPTQELIYALTVKDAMRKDVFTVSPSMKFYDLREFLKEKNISGAPVVFKGKLRGIISIEDLIECLARGDMGKEIEETMTTKVTVCHPDDLLIRATQILERSGFGRLPVVERKSGKLVGILTKGDVVLCLLRKMEELYDRMEDAAHETSAPLYRSLGGGFRFETETVVRKMDFSSAGTASSGFREAMKKFGVPPECVRRASICSYEAEMNMVIYSKGGTMSLRIERDRVTIGACDEGPGIDDLKKAMTPGFSTAPDWVRELGFGAGMGLPNMKSNSDKFSVKTKRDKYTRLSIEVELP